MGSLLGVFQKITSFKMEPEGEVRNELINHISACIRVGSGDVTGKTKQAQKKPTGQGFRSLHGTVYDTNAQANTVGTDGRRRGTEGSSLRPVGLGGRCLRCGRVGTSAGCLGRSTVPCALPRPLSHSTPSRISVSFSYLPCWPRSPLSHTPRSQSLSKSWYSFLSVDLAL